MNRVMSKLEERILQCIPQDHILAQSMKYSLFPGGKRIRPYLYFLFRNLFSEITEEDLTFAAALEMIHTYSLIHDDLPSMDNDDMRRGKLSNHKVYGEALAILSGDALLNRAYEILFELSSKKENYREASLHLAKAAGYQGMILGQVMDMDLETKQATLKEVEEMIRLKTGELLASSILCAGLVSKSEVDLKPFAYDLGKAFQIQDDILDVIGNQEDLGKTVGKDEKSQKSNFVTLYGLEKAQSLLDELVEKMKEETKKFSSFGNIKPILEVIDFVKGRKY